MRRWIRGFSKQDTDRAHMSAPWRVASLALVLGGCAVDTEPDDSHDGLQDQLDALTDQVDVLKSEVASLADQLEALQPGDPTGLEWEVFTYTCDVADNGPILLGRSAEGIAVTHTFFRQASEPEDTWRTSVLAIDIDEGELTIHCSSGGSADTVYVYLVALGWQR